MSLKVDLQEDEHLLCQNWVPGPWSPMALAVSDRALFIAREQHFRRDAYYMKRIPIPEVREVVVRKLGMRRAWIFSGLSILAGLILQKPVFSDTSLGLSQAAFRSAMTGGVMIILGAALPVIAHGRQILSIRTKNKSFDWNPSFFNNTPRAHKLQDDFLNACRYVDVPTKWLDFPGQRRIDHFWKWFARYSQKSSLSAEAIRRKVKKLCGGLDIELRHSDNSRELIITANDNKDLFTVVDHIVSRAPNISGWNFLALRPRNVIDEIFDFEGEQFDTNEFFFVPYTDDFELGIHVYGRLADERSRRASSAMIWELLGERDLATKVRYFDFFTTEQIKQTEEDHLIPLTALPYCVDDFFRRTAN